MDPNGQPNTNTSGGVSPENTNSNPEQGAVINSEAPNSDQTIQGAQPAVDSPQAATTPNVPITVTPSNQEPASYTTPPAPTVPPQVAPVQPTVSAQMPMQQPVQAPLTGGVQNPNGGQSARDPGTTPAIIGLVLAFMMPLVGLILSIIALKKSKKAGFKNIIAIVGVVLNAITMLIATGLVLLMGFAFIAGLQANAKANAFIAAVESGDYDTAIGYTDATEAEKAASKTYLTHVKDSIGSEQSVAEVEFKDGVWVGLYQTNGTRKYLRVTIKDGIVTDVTISNTPLKLTPDKTSTQSTDSATTSEAAAATAPTAPAQTCTPLAAADFYTISGQSDYPLNYYEDIVFFEPDSTTYTYQYTTPQQYQKIAAFAKATTKPYKIELAGSVFSDYNTAGGKQLAQQRSEKIQTELIAAGVPTSTISIVAPKEYPYGQQAQYGSNIYRNVSVTIKTTCAAS